MLTCLRVFNSTLWRPRSSFHISPLFQSMGISTISNDDFPSIKVFQNTSLIIKILVQIVPSAFTCNYVIAYLLTICAPHRGSFYHYFGIICDRAIFKVSYYDDDNNNINISTNCRYNYISLRSSRGQNLGSAKSSKIEDSTNEINAGFWRKVITRRKLSDNTMILLYVWAFSLGIPTFFNWDLNSSSFQIRNVDNKFFAIQARYCLNLFTLAIEFLD